MMSKRWKNQRKGNKLQSFTYRNNMVKPTTGGVVATPTMSKQFLTLNQREQFSDDYQLSSSKVGAR